MKKILVIVTMAAVFMMSGTALSQAEVEWKGFYWNAYQGALIAKNANRYLEVEPTGDSGAAYYRAPIDFRSARTPWIEATFFDDGQSSGIQLMMKNTSRAYTEIGAGRLQKNYWIYWFNYLSGRNGLVGTPITRTPGQHSVKLGMQENGTVDYWIDDVRVWSTNNINPESFDIVFLAAQGSTGTFIDYQVGMDYRASQLVVECSIDIKPGGNPNDINLKSKGVVPVAILTDETFDAATVDPLSIAFGPDGASEAHGRGHIEDVDGDSDLDLVLHFKIQDTGIACGDTSAFLRGKTSDGKEIKGSDSINTVGCK
jgi:hypothetical protein